MAINKLEARPKNHTGLVYFHTEADLQVPPPQWGAYLHPAQPVDHSKGNYYYAYIFQTDSA